MAAENFRADVAVIGAGISGLAAADRLMAGGVGVRLIEKSGGTSGRVSTRRWGGARVDHGAQFFTVRTRDFETRVGQWLDAGLCFRWTKGFHHFEKGVLAGPSGSEAFPRYACRDGMSAIGRAMAEGLPVCLDHKVTSVSRDDLAWTVTCDNGSAIEAGALLVSPPAPQALALLDEAVRASEPGLVESLSSIRYSPCLCVAAEYDAPEPEWKGVQFRDDPVLSWAGNDSSRRGAAAYSTGSLVIVLHAAPDFSERWQDANLDDAAGRMLARASETLGAWLAAPRRWFVHRWRYAHVAHGYSETPFLRTQSGPPAYVIGDAFMGARVEGAYLSGLAAANDLLVRHAEAT